MLAEFLPSHGNILLTTRSQVTGGAAQRIDLEEMIPEEGALFLLRRARLVQPGLPYGAVDARLRAEAKEAAELLDGLPLALDQAGAYIEETSCTLFDYLDRYRERRADLLRRRGSHPPSDHPEPVATTWSLSFEKVEQANRPAADILRLCAYLAPDAIPEEIIGEGALELGPPLASLAADRLELDEALRELRKFSLIRRTPETRTLSIHRLVQAVIRDSMEEQEQGQWMEWAVRAVNSVFPDGEDVAGWPQCERCLSQVLACAAMIDERPLVFPEAARLLNQAGLFLLERAQYSLSEHLIRKALAIRTLLEGSHADVKATAVAESLNDLGAVYASQGDYAQAEPLLQQALSIHARVLGPGHPDVATATNNVAMTNYYQGKYAEAEPLFLRALAIWQQQPGPDHPDYARTTSNLALLYFVQGRYTEAEPLYRRALAIWEGIVGPEHPDVARTLNNLGKLYRLQGKYAEAEPLLLRARAIREKTLGPDHPGVAQTLGELAQLYSDQGRYAEAEPLYQLALEIREEALGPVHASVAEILESYAALLKAMGRAGEAATLASRAESARDGRRE
jgi:tetratricopeptide (TPR) repeat protein